MLFQALPLHTCLGTHPPLAPAPWSLCMSFAQIGPPAGFPSSLLCPAQVLPPDLPGRDECPPPFDSSIVCLVSRDTNAPWPCQPCVGWFPSKSVFGSSWSSTLHSHADTYGPKVPVVCWAVGDGTATTWLFQWSLLGSLWMGCPCHCSSRSSTLRSELTIPLGPCRLVGQAPRGARRTSVPSPCILFPPWGAAVGRRVSTDLALHFSVGSEPSFPLRQRPREVLPTRAQPRAGMWKAFGKQQLPSPLLWPLPVWCLSPGSSRGCFCLCLPSSEPFPVHPGCPQSPVPPSRPGITSPCVACLSSPLRYLTGSQAFPGEPRCVPSLSPPCAPGPDALSLSAHSIPSCPAPGLPPAQVASSVAGTPSWKHPPQP